MLMMGNISSIDGDVFKGNKPAYNHQPSSRQPIRHYRSDAYPADRHGQHAPERGPLKTRSRGYPAPEQGQSPTSNRDHRDPNRGSQRELSIKSALSAINKILNQWSDIMKNTRSKEHMDEELQHYLWFQIEDTNKEWNKLIQLRPQSSSKPEYTQSSPDKRSDQLRSSVDEQLSSMQETITELSVKLADKQNQIKQQSEDNTFLRQRMCEIEEKNSELTTRLSKQASDMLLKSNPNITDLSDVNRPSKLGETYSELYDNEYTEAMVALTENGYTERESINTLRTTLLDTYRFCSEKANALLTSSEEAINTLFGETDTSENKHKTANYATGNHRSNARTLMPGEGPRLLREHTNIEDLKFALRWKPKRKDIEGYVEKQVLQESQHGKIPTVGDEMKAMRKSVASAIFHLVFKAYLRTRWGPDCIPELKPFIERCVFLTWMMNVQSPAMAFLDWCNDLDEQFDCGRYRAYTQIGTYIDYVVWPTLMLTKDGPIIVKGVAQGKH